MKSDKTHQSLEKLRHVYQKALQWMEKNLEERQKLNERLHQAKQKMIELEHLSEEEAHKVTEYLERDLHEAVYFLNDAEKWLADWLYFDYKVIKQDLWDAFLAVANKTALEYEQFKFDLKHGLTYHTDEIIGLGSLQCLSCQHKIHFEQVSIIPTCPKCGHTDFARI